MSYAAYDMLQLQLNRILVAQLILLVVTFNMLPLAFILLIIMLLLLFAALKPSAPLFPIGHFSVLTTSYGCRILFYDGRLKLVGL